MRRWLATLLGLFLATSALAESEALQNARELIADARAELEEVLTADDSTAADRSAALELLQSLGGKPASGGAAPSLAVVDNGDGTATDPVTGLMWTTKDSGGATTYEGAVRYCDLTKRGGHDDWRVPTLAEMDSLQVEGSFQQYKLSPLINLSGCAPWVTGDARKNASNLEVDFCAGHQDVVTPEFKRAPALCVRGPLG